MKLSVSIITYNHEKFIAHAIESVLMQKTDFKYELLIGEDDSSDRTRDIVKKYAEKYPDKIRLFLNDRKNVIYINGHATGKWNMINTLKNARGKYIALLDGDDYWTDAYKLQKQVDFLESKPDFVICCHNSKHIYLHKPKRARYRRPDKSAQTKDVLTIEDQIRDVASSYHTSSVVYRNGLLEIPEFYMQIESGDIALFTMLAQFGKIKYLDEVMSVYRKHGMGISQSHRGEKLFKARLKMNSLLDKYFNEKYTNLYKVINEGLYTKLFQTYIKEKRLYPLAKHSLIYLISKNSSPKSYYKKVVAIMKNFCPLQVKLLILLFLRRKQKRN